MSPRRHPPGYGPEYFDRAGRRLIERAALGLVLAVVLALLNWAGCLPAR